MGLDMYLHRKAYVGGNYEHNAVSGCIDIIRKGKKLAVDLKKVVYIEEFIGYWRKANQIHNWFVNNIQNGIDNCREYYVGIDKLRELKSLCEQILGGKSEEERKALAEELLPPQSGFFFGDTDIDEYYFQDLKDTIDIIGECEQYAEDDFVYTSSW